MYYAPNASFKMDWTIIMSDLGLWDMDDILSREQNQAKDIEHRYPGLLKQISNIINSRV